MKSISSSVVFPVALLLGSSNAGAVPNMTAPDFDSGRWIDGGRSRYAKVGSLPQSPLITEFTLISELSDSERGANVSASVPHDDYQARIRKRLATAAKKVAEAEWFRAVHVGVEPPQFTRIEADATT
jgi:hypothetical protein